VSGWRTPDLAHTLCGPVHTLGEMPRVMTDERARAALRWRVIGETLAPNQLVPAAEDSFYRGGVTMTARGEPARTAQGGITARAGENGESIRSVEDYQPRREGLSRRTGPSDPTPARGPRQTSQEGRG
jgi:hypothetical protein